MFRPRALSVVAFVLLASVTGCRTGSAATMPDGSRISILVLPDRTVAPDVSPERAEQLNDLITWMEQDLIDLLERIGYVAVHLDDPSTTPGLNRYVLHFEVTHYDAVSRAASFFSKMGDAGMARVDTHFELIGPGNTVVASGNPSAAGAPDWAKAARIVNKETRDVINGRLRLVH